MRHFLRGKTAALHSELDAIVGETDTLAGYKRYLAALLTFREPLEIAIAQAPALAQLGWHPRLIADAIRQDMQDLGLTMPAPDHSAAPIGDASALVGTLYVLEGSALGARVLYRRAQTLGLSADFGARHLAKQTEEKSGWPAFLAVLERHDESNAEDTALASLAAFEHALVAFKGSFQGECRE